MTHPDKLLPVRVTHELSRPVAACILATAAWEDVTDYGQHPDRYLSRAAALSVVRDYLTENGIGSLDGWRDDHGDPDTAEGWALEQVARMYPWGQCR